MEKIILDNGKQQREVKVGDGCTICYYSDREPATIIDIKNDGRVIVVQEDKATRTDNNGMSEIQEYEFERNPKGTIHEFKRTRKYKWFYTDNGCADRTKYGTYLCFSGREKYYDYSF